MAEKSEENSPVEDAHATEVAAEPPAEEPIKKGRGRPKGSADLKPRVKRIKVEPIPEPPQPVEEVKPVAEPTAPVKMKVARAKSTPQPVAPQQPEIEPPSLRTEYRLVRDRMISLKGQFDNDRKQLLATRYTEKLKPLQVF